MEDILEPTDTPDSDGRREVTSLDELVSVLSLQVALRLDEFGLHMPLDDTRGSVFNWLRDKFSGPKAAAMHDLVPAHMSIVKALAEEISMAVITDLAEERPGTDPWEHESTIPVPLMISSIVGHSVGVCTGVALTNQHVAWMRQGQAIMTSLFAAIAHQVGIDATFDDDVEMPSSPNGPRRIFNGVAYLMPQPAIAHMARYLESTAHRIRSREWVISDELSPEEQIEEAALTSDNLDELAGLLRHLNARYGISPNPTSAS